MNNFVSDLINTGNKQTNQQTKTDEFYVTDIISNECIYCHYKPHNIECNRDHYSIFTNKVKKSQRDHKFAQGT